MHELFWLQLIAFVASADLGTYSPTPCSHPGTNARFKGQFSSFFSGLCRLSQGETHALASRLGYTFMLNTLLVISCICHYILVPHFSCNNKCVSFMVLLQFIRAR